MYMSIRSHLVRLLNRLSTFWTNLSQMQNILGVALFTFISSIFLIAIAESLPIFSSSDVQTVVLGTIAVTSFYIAFQKLLIRDSHNIQIFAESKNENNRSSSEIDNPISKVEINAVNIGNRPITVRGLPYIYGKLCKKGILVGFDSNELHIPVSPGEKINTEIIKENILFYRFLEPQCTDSIGNFHEASLMGKYADIHNPEGLNDSMKLMRFVRVLADVSDDKINLMSEKENLLPFEVLEEYKEEDIVAAFFHGVGFEALRNDNLQP